MLQFIDIKDSKVKFVNQENDPVAPLFDITAEVVFDRMMDQMRIVSLEDTQAEMIFDIMSMKMGV